MDWLLFIGIFVAWYALNRWILPRMGIQTECRTVVSFRVTVSRKIKINNRCNE